MPSQVRILHLPPSEKAWVVVRTPAVPDPGRCPATRQRDSRSQAFPLPAMNVRRVAAISWRLASAQSGPLPARRCAQQRHDSSRHERKVENMKTLYTAEAVVEGGREARSNIRWSPRGRPLRPGRHGRPGRHRNQPRAALCHRIRRLLSVSAPQRRQRAEARRLRLAHHCASRAGARPDMAAWVSPRRSTCMRRSCRPPMRRPDGPSPPALPLLERDPGKHRRQPDGGRSATRGHPSGLIRGNRLTAGLD